MDFDQVRKYWEERAALDSSAQSTTQDFYMREIELRVVSSLIEKYQPTSVFDVGCGDARTTARLAAVFTNTNFFGGDYSESMVANAQVNIAGSGISNLQVMLCDISKPLPVSSLDMIYTTRCLINLPSWDLQQLALQHIAAGLRVGGLYVMIENFNEGNDNFNQIRREYGLPEIPVRDHNFYFNREQLVQYVEPNFDVLEEVNISSTYYLVSRVIYSKICQKEGKTPDYFDIHHESSAQLPFCGEFGPVRMICMRRK